MQNCTFIAHGGGGGGEERERVDAVSPCVPGQCLHVRYGNPTLLFNTQPSERRSTRVVENGQYKGTQGAPDLSPLRSIENRMRTAEEVGQRTQGTDTRVQRSGSAPVRTRVREGCTEQRAPQVQVGGVQLPEGSDTGGEFGEYRCPIPLYRRRSRRRGGRRRRFRWWKAEHRAPSRLWRVRVSLQIQHSGALEALPRVRTLPAWIRLVG